MNYDFTSDEMLGFLVSFLLLAVFVLLVVAILTVIINWKMLKKLCSQRPIMNGIHSITSQNGIPEI